MQAGKEVIAETPVISEEVSAEIVNQTKDNDYSKRKKNIAYSILSAATGKSAKWLKMQLGAKSDNKGMIKRKEFIEDLAREVADNIAGADGMLPEWREFYTYNEGEIDADYNLAMQALNDILNDNFEKTETEIIRIYNEEIEYYENIIKDIKEKLDKAENADELFNLYDNELNNSYVQNLERLTDEGRNKKTERRNSQEISERNFGTTQTSNDRGIQGNLNQTQGQNQEINPDTKLNQLKNTPKQPKIFKGAYDVSAKAIELFKDADYSTLPHELAHFWLDNMWGYYRSGKASEAYSNNFKGVLDWLGVKDALQKRKQVGCILPVKILH